MLFLPPPESERATKALFFESYCSLGFEQAAAASRQAAALGSVDPLEARERRHRAALAGLIGIGPQDEMEGMIAAQLIATHNATMECYRRAMIAEQTLEGRRENLNPSQQARSHLRDFDRGA